MNRHRNVLIAVVLFGNFLLSSLATAESVTLGAENDAAPWSYADGTGYVNDLVRAAYQAVGWKVEYNTMPYARCKYFADIGVLAGCFSASKTPETEKGMQFPATAVFAAENGLYVRTDSTLAGCSPAQWGRKISLGLVNGYEYGPKVAGLIASGEVTVDKAISEAGALRMLNGQRFDAVIITTDPIKHIEYVAALAGVNVQYRLACKYGAEPAYIGFSRKNPQSEAALAAFDRGMEILKKDGTIKRLQSEWAQKALKGAKPEQ